MLKLEQGKTWSSLDLLLRVLCENHLKWCITIIKNIIKLNEND